MTKARAFLKETVKMRPFKHWTEGELRNAIWSEVECGAPQSPYPTDEYRKELRLRGLSEDGYHST